MDFSSVGDFLRQAATAKQDKRQAIDDQLMPLMEDPATVGIPPNLAAAIETLLEAYGDETYRQIALFCLGKWHRKLIVKCCSSTLKTMAQAKCLW
jgi:hypothetical protein